MSTEPTIYRMVLRLGVVAGLLILSTQIALLLHLNPTNTIALFGIGSLPAVGLLIIEKLFEWKAAEVRIRLAEEANASVEYSDNRLDARIILRGLRRRLALEESLETQVQASIAEALRRYRIEEARQK